MKDRITTYFEGNWSQFYRKYLPNTKKIRGHEYRALCPFHEDKNPSFNFNDQTGMYLCHGCEEKGDGFHFYAETHGLNDKMDFPKILKGIAEDFGIHGEQQGKRIIETYDYTDAEGNLVSQVCRMEPKGFKQRRRDENGNWIWDLHGVETVLYNLPDVIKAKEVLIVEGEKDADMANDMGFTATTCPMGAGKWRDHYNLSLKGKDIVLLPDNDEAGREHMMRVATS
jgi:DNA primase